MRAQHPWLKTVTREEDKMGFKKAVYKASATATPGASPAVPKGLMGKIIKALEVSGALQSATSGSRASSNPKGLAGKVVKALGEEGKLKNVAEKTVASATGMKKGGSVDKMGRAVKRKTADVKGRAMKGK